MPLPTKYLDIVLSDLEPGKAYQKCMQEIASDSRDVDYGFTEAIVYATEVRYAVDALTKGRPDHFWNFGDLKGGADDWHFSILDDVKNLNIAFVGGGPYPVSAFILRERYPQASITCIDNHIAAHILSTAVIEKLDLGIATCFTEAIEVDYSPFNAVVIAAMVSGKDEFVKKILEKSSATVIVRGDVDVDHDRLHRLNSGFDNDGSVGAS